jgi:hypothetical protein
MSRIVFLFATILGQAFVSYSNTTCLFKNPLCFYNTDILSYIQVLHKNQQYDKISPFFYGPKKDNISAFSLRQQLSEVDFGYSIKLTGIKQTSKTSWSLTYQRTIFGTNESFKIQCKIINDTCKVYLDSKTWKTLFRN